MTSLCKPNPTVVFGTDRFDLNHLEQRGARAAVTLQAQGIGPGSTVALLLRNEPAVIEALTCIRCLEGLRANIPWHLTPSEVASILLTLRPRALIAHADLLAALLAAGIKLSACAAVVISTPKCLETVYAIKQPQHKRFPASVRRWEKLIAAAPENAPIKRGAPAAIGLTSGSTGTPKVVRWQGKQQWQQWYKNRTVDRPTIKTSLVTAPLFNGGQYGVFCQSWRLRANHIMLPKFDAEEFLRQVEQHRVTHAYLVPTMFVRLLRLPRRTRERYDISTLNYVFHTGALCAPEVKRRMLDWFGPVIWEAYGASEVSTVSVSSSHDWLRRPGTVGRPVRPVMIFNDQGKPLPAKEPGRIHVALEGMPRPTISGAKAPVLQRHAGKQWFPVGDAGYLDPDGYLFVLGRTDDLINTGRVKVYPLEIENALLAHPCVQDCVVRGRADAEFGQVITAAVEVTSDRRVQSSELRQFLSNRLSEHKIPVAWAINTQALHTADGKLRRQADGNPPKLAPVSA